MGSILSDECVSDKMEPTRHPGTTETRRENARKWPGETAHNFARIARILTSLAPMKSSHSGLFIGATLVKIRAILVELYIIFLPVSREGRGGLQRRLTSSTGDVPLGFHLIRRFQGARVPSSMSPYLIRQGCISSVLPRTFR